jgi:hypothetical protein
VTELPARVAACLRLLTLINFFRFACSKTTNSAKPRHYHAIVNVSEVFIRRPIATSLIMLGIALFGILAYRAQPGRPADHVPRPDV